MRHPPCELASNSVFRPVRMLVCNPRPDQLTGETPELIDHGEPLGYGLGAQNLGHLVVDDFQVAEARLHEDSPTVCAVFIMESLRDDTQEKRKRRDCDSSSVHRTCPFVIRPVLLHLFAEALPGG